MDQLKRLRMEKGLSQAKLAALADVDPSTVNQIERGARDASPATLRKLAEALDVSIAAPVGRAGRLVVADRPQRRRLRAQLVGHVGGERPESPGPRERRAAGEQPLAVLAPQRPQLGERRIGRLAQHHRRRADRQRERHPGRPLDATTFVSA